MKCVLAEHEVYILNAPTDDYENFEHIVLEVSGSVDVAVSEDQILDGVKKLVQNGLLDMFVSDRETQSFKPVILDPTFDIKNDAWFFITERGRQVLNENWTSDFDRKWNKDT